MNKTDAIQLLGGSITAAAEAVGTSYQAVSKWPDILPRRIEDRVIAAIARRRLPPDAFCVQENEPPNEETSHAQPNLNRAFP